MNTNNNRKLRLGGPWQVRSRGISKTEKKSVPEIGTTTANGHIYFDNIGINPDGTKTTGRKQMFLDGRNEISKLLSQYDDEYLKREYGIDRKQWDNDTNELWKNKSTNKDDGFNNINSRRVYWFLSDIKDNDPYFVKNKADENKTNDPEKGIYNEIPLGAGVTYGVSTFKYLPNSSSLTRNERKAIRDYYGPNFDKTDNITTFIDDNGYKHITIGTKTNPIDNTHYDITNSKSFVLNKNGERVGLIPTYSTTPNGQTYVSDYELAKDGDVGVVYDIDDISDYNKEKDRLDIKSRVANTNNYGHYDPKGLMQNYRAQEWEYEAFGGPTTRLYAVGGTTGEQIPIGEQPDYNMVGAGGSHEQNPQGGVPYGMNQDGSQNMVEQGEVSVGNNVFSDRTAMSPELCQQLGLPEGTSPAQAMQQIEALYEQGQIGDAEFQEIQQIIFEDQEAQKQGAMPQEGISPEMMGMPQQQPMPMQNEGISPEMMQGGAMAFGGRRRC